MHIKSGIVVFGESEDTRRITEKDDAITASLSGCINHGKAIQISVLAQLA